MDILQGGRLNLQGLMVYSSLASDLSDIRTSFCGFKGERLLIETTYENILTPSLALHTGGGGPNGFFCRGVGLIFKV